VGDLGDCPDDVVGGKARSGFDAMIDQGLKVILTWGFWEGRHWKPAAAMRRKEKKEPIVREDNRCQNRRGQRPDAKLGVR
jgi:hypothetical protein